MPPQAKVVIDKKLFSRAVKDRKSGERQRHLESIDKDFDKEAAALKKLLVEKLMKIVGGKVSQGVFNYYKEEQVKKGVKFTQKVLSSLDFLIINGDGWIRDADNCALAARLIHNYNLKYNDLLGVYKRKKFQVTVGDELPAGIVKLAKVYVAGNKLKVGDKMAGHPETRALWPALYARRTCHSWRMAPRSTSC